MNSGIRLAVNAACGCPWEYNVMYKGSVAEEAREVLRAIELIRLGARMPVLERELALSRDRISRIYRETKRALPPKGALPFSTDWYFARLPNIHASLFYNIYLFLRDEAKCSRFDALTRAYRLYLEHCESAQIERVLSFTRAWSLLRFFEGRLLTLTRCAACSGRFVRRMQETHAGSPCLMCAAPPTTLPGASGLAPTRVANNTSPPVAIPA